MNMRTMVFAMALALAQGAVWADGVTRTLQKDGSIYHVTLTWTFSESIDSDLVIEEKFPDGWNVNTETVPTDGTLDATYIAGSIARFAVNPTNLTETGSIQFDIKPGSTAGAGSVKGTWRMYLGGKLQRGTSDGAANLDAPSGLLSVASAAKSAETSEETTVELPVAIKSFKMLPGSCIELSYGVLPAAGRLVVEGCEGLGKDWQEITFKDVEAAADKVELDQATVGNRRFMRMKLYTKEQK